MASVRVAVAGARDVDVALSGWLQSVPELRGQVRREQVMPKPGEQGATGDLLVALASTGAATALATSLQVWLSNRHTDVTVSVSIPDGRQITLSATHAHDLNQVRALLTTALEADAE